MDRNKYSFKNLDIWKRAQDLAAEVAEIVDELPNRRSADVVGRQLLRSATSIAANIAEGHGRYSFGAYRNHLSIARGSAAESQGWLDLLVRRGHLKADKGAELEQRCETLIAALTRRMVALERQAQAVREPPREREEGPVWQADGIDVPMFQGSNDPDTAPRAEIPGFTDPLVPDLLAQEEDR